MTDDRAAAAARILLADDERPIRAGLAAALESAGYCVVQARDGESAVRLFMDAGADLVLLDVMMPRMDGLSACAKIRETNAHVPIIFLSALDDDTSQMDGLGLGADDYIAKTAPIRVLLARVAAALRRANNEEPSVDFDFGAWRVNPVKFSMRRCTGECAGLSDREVALLRLFAAHPGEVLGRDNIVARLWGVDAEVSDVGLSVAVHKLRAKLQDDGWLIRSHRGIGYSYESPPGNGE